MQLCTARVLHIKSPSNQEFATLLVATYSLVGLIRGLIQKHTQCSWPCGVSHVQLLADPMDPGGKRKTGKFTSHRPLILRNGVTMNSAWVAATIRVGWIFCLLKKSTSVLSFLSPQPQNPFGCPLRKERRAWHPTAPCGNSLRSSAFYGYRIKLIEILWRKMKKYEVLL